MERQDRSSPLPRDPAGREDIMSDEPREEEVRPGPGEGPGDGSPLPRESAGHEDIITD